MYVLVLYVWHRGIKSATCQRFIANLIVPTIVDIGKVFLISLRAAPLLWCTCKACKTPISAWECGNQWCKSVELLWIFMMIWTGKLAHTKYRDLISLDLSRIEPWDAPFPGKTFTTEPHRITVVPWIILTFTNPWEDKHPASHQHCKTASTALPRTHPQDAWRWAMLSLFQLMVEEDQVDRGQVTCPDAAGGYRKWSASRRHCLFSYRPVHLEKICSRLLRSRMMIMT